MRKLKRFFLFLLTLLLLGTQVAPQTAQAADPRVAKVSFTFDDGFASTVTKAAPVLQKYGIKGTIYVSTGCVDATGSCRQNVNPPASYLTWTQVKQLKNTYGWEIGAHTVNHTRLTTLTDAQKIQEITQSNQRFSANGITPVDFASPEGDYDYRSLAVLAKYYQSHRGFWDQNVNNWPNNAYILNVKQVQTGVTVAQVKTAIDQAIANKQWIILVFHDIKDKASTNPDDYEYATSALDQIASYVKSKQSAGALQSVTVNDALKVTQTNILPNNTFNKGVGEGWTVDNASAVVQDTNTNGSYPSAKEAIKFTGTAQGHLYSPSIPAIANSTYAFKAFVNTLGQKTGEFGFYVDEYDKDGNWISGKWLGGVWIPTVSEFSAYYTPTSTAVSTFRIQTYFSGTPSGTIYVDNFKLYNLTTSQSTAVVTPTPLPTKTPTPTPTSAVTPTPTVTPVQSPNLVSNGSFEQLETDGFAVDWKKDNNLFTIDKNTKGNNGSNSLTVSPTQNANSLHVFSANIPVNASSAYKWSHYVNISSGMGELGFYIDEFDAHGNWISGQWKGNITELLTGTREISYTPTSSDVVSVRLQYYLTANSQFQLFIDSVYFGKDTTVTPTVTVAPSLSPSPTVIISANLVPNFSFEDVANGWANKWTKDSDLFSLDTDSQGNDGKNSIHLVSSLTTGKGHLFSEKISIEAATTYQWQQYIKASGTGTDFNFYIDEYDADGNWISGQWKGKVASFTGTKAWTYTPTSSNVKSIRLQYGITAGSETNLFLDSVKFGR